MRWYDDLQVLPTPEREWSRSWRQGSSDEDMAIWMTLRVLVKHAAEAGDERMTGRVLAAFALTGQNVAWVWDEYRDLIGTELPAWDGTAAHGSTRGKLLDEKARAFAVRGVRRRPARLLRAEARGLLFALRWLFRAGLLPMQSLRYAEMEPWRRVTGAPVGAHPNILGPLPPAAANLN